MTVTSATRRETTRAARTSDVFTTARPPSWEAGLLNVMSIVCRMLGRKTLVGALVAGFLWWRARSIPLALFGGLGAWWLIAVLLGA